MTDNDDLMGGGMLSQSELDALLAAAGAETPGDGWVPEAAEVPGEALDLGASDSPPPAVHAAMPSLVDLPAFDAPSLTSPPSASAFSSAPESSGIQRVPDIPLEVTVELGRTRLLIRDILDLGAGSIIELDKLAGEPVDLFANGLLVARGEVVVIDDNFGVRVTEIITAADRQGGKAAHAQAA